MSEREVLRKGGSDKRMGVQNPTVRAYSSTVRQLYKMWNEIDKQHSLNNNNNNNGIRNQISQDKSLFERPGFRWDSNIKMLEQNPLNLLKT